MKELEMSDIDTEAPDLSQSYTEIKEDLQYSESGKSSVQEQKQDLVSEQPESRPDDTQELDTQKDSKPKRKPRQRKDVSCEDCGKTYSSKTKSHKCVPPTGFVKLQRETKDIPQKGLESPRLPLPSPLPSPSPPPAPHHPSPPPPHAQREITIDDVRGFLVKEKAAKTEQRRNTWISSLF